MWKGQCVPMTTLSWGSLCCYPNSRKSYGTRRHASVNRNNTQTSKVWTIQMMMTLILTSALHVKTNTDWVSVPSIEIKLWQPGAFTGNRNFNQKGILKSVWKIHAAYSIFKKIKRKKKIFLFVWERFLHSRLDYHMDNHSPPCEIGYGRSIVE